MEFYYMNLHLFSVMSNAALDSTIFSSKDRMLLFPIALREYIPIWRCIYAIFIICNLLSYNFKRLSNN